MRLITFSHIDYNRVSLLLEEISEVCNRSWFYSLEQEGFHVNHCANFSYNHLLSAFVSVTILVDSRYLVR